MFLTLVGAGPHLPPGLDLGFDWIAWGQRQNPTLHREGDEPPPLQPNGNNNVRKTGEKSKSATLKSVAIKTEADRLFCASYRRF
jgi:hypothetical protein